MCGRIIWITTHVVWSGRAQTRTLASCNIEKHRVKVARELNYPQHLIWLKPLLYHEMCHAYLGTSIYHNKHYQWHGKAFRTLVQRHPLTVIFERWVKEGGWQLALEGDKGRRQLVGVSL